MAAHGALGVALPSLKAKRVDAALRQTELAERAQVARATIQRAERGENVSLVNARRLAEALNVTVEQLRASAPGDGASSSRT